MPRSYRSNTSALHAEEKGALPLRGIVDMIAPKTAPFCRNPNLELNPRNWLGKHQKLMKALDDDGILSIDGGFEYLDENQQADVARVILETKDRTQVLLNVRKKYDMGR